MCCKLKSSWSRAYCKGLLTASHTFSLSLSSPFSHWLGNHSETQIRSTSSIQPRINLWLTKVNPLSSCSVIWTLNSLCWGNSNGALSYISLRISLLQREGEQGTKIFCLTRKKVYLPAGRDLQFFWFLSFLIFLLVVLLKVGKDRCKQS